MNPRLLLLSTSLLATEFVADAGASDRELIGGKEYERVNGAWYEIDARGEVWKIATGSICVTFRPDASTVGIDEWARQQALERSPHALSLPASVAYRYSNELDPVDTLKRILQSDLVERASLDTYLKFLYSPDDTYYSAQWNMRHIELERAWNITTGDPAVKIAIIDGGSQYDHEDLAATAWHNSGEIENNGLDDDLNGFPDDIVGWDFVDEDNDPRPGKITPPAFVTADRHGTPCVAIAGAVTNNAKGTAGVAGGCRFVHIRADKLLDAAAALNYCWSNGVNIVSMSWAGNASDEAFIAEINNAYAHGTLLLAAAGNLGGAPPTFPANHPNVIAVGATNESDSLAVYSSHGEIMAPSRRYAVIETGDELWVADNQGTFGGGTSYYEYNPTNCLCPLDAKYYAYFGGTSAACPTAAGVAGLILSHEPTLTNVAVRERLRTSAVDVCAPGVDQACGYGRVDAYRALTKWGIINQNTMWSGTVYVSGDVVVADGTTLTVAPGTTVRIAADDNEHAGTDADRIELNIEGRLVAVGTLANPIIFEAWTPTSSDDWVGFYFDDQSDGGRFTRCGIRNAESAIESYVDLEVRNTTIENCGAGIVSYGGAAFVKDCAISAEFWGIYASGGDVTVRNTAVSDPSASCLQVQNGSSLVARGSQFTNGGNGLLANTNAVVSIDSSCVFSSNDVGVYFHNAASSTLLKGSTLNSNTGNGIRCDNASHPLIQDNTVRYNALGIYCTNSSSPVIKGNMIKTNTYGVSAATGANPDIGTYPSSGGNTIAFSSQKHAVNWNEFEIKAEVNCWNVNTGDCYPPASKIQGLVDTDYPDCCTTMAGASELIPDPEPEKTAPQPTDLVGVVPNPFNPSSTIHYSLADQETVRIVVYDVAGRSVRDLIDRVEQPGSHTALWDGTDAKGNAVASGVYFVRFSAGPVSRTMKMILVK